MKFVWRVLQLDEYPCFTHEAITLAHVSIKLEQFFVMFLGSCWKYPRQFLSRLGIVPFFYSYTLLYIKYLLGKLGVAEKKIKTLNTLWFRGFGCVFQEFPWGKI